MDVDAYTLAIGRVRRADQRGAGRRVVVSIETHDGCHVARVCWGLGRPREMCAVVVSAHVERGRWVAQVETRDGRRWRVSVPLAAMRGPWTHSDTGEPVAVDVVDVTTEQRRVRR